MSSNPQMERSIREGEEKKRKIREANFSGFFIPYSEAQWQDLARHSKRTNNIHRLDKDMIQSGSNTTNLQFLSYRTIYDYPDDRLGFLEVMEDFGVTNEVRQAAGKVVSQSNEFNKLVSVMKANIPIDVLHESDENWPGSWVSIKSFQENIKSPRRTTTRNDTNAMFKAAEHLNSDSREAIASVLHSASHSKPPQKKRRVQTGRVTAYEVSGFQETVAMSKKDFPDAEDESIVNTYAIILLQQTSRLLKYFLVKWTMDKIKLDASFRASEYKAYTDGGLRPRGGGLIQASVEVKKGIRASNLATISKQETSQVVAMIQKGCPAIYNDHWLVVSVDRHEVYLNFSSCKPEYVRYICNASASPASFLRTKTFGPWDITDSSQIWELVRILVALTLKANLVAAEAISRGEMRPGVDDDDFW